MLYSEIVLVGHILSCSVYNLMTDVVKSGEMAQHNESWSLLLGGGGLHYEFDSTQRI